MRHLKKYNIWRLIMQCKIQKNVVQKEKEHYDWTTWDNGLLKKRDYFCREAVRKEMIPKISLEKGECKSSISCQTCVLLDCVWRKFFTPI